MDQGLLLPAVLLFPRNRWARVVLVIIALFAVFRVIAYHSCRAFDRSHPRHDTAMILEILGNHQREQFEQQLHKRFPNGFELRELRRSELEKSNWWWMTTYSRLKEILTRTGKSGLHRLTIVSEDSRNVSEAVVEAMQPIYQEWEAQRARDHEQGLKQLQSVIDDPMADPRLRKNAALTLAAIKSIKCSMPRPPIKLWERLPVEPHATFNTPAVQGLLATVSITGALISLFLVPKTDSNVPKSDGEETAA